MKVKMDIIEKFIKKVIKKRNKEYQDKYRLNPIFLIGNGSKPKRNKGDKHMGNYCIKPVEEQIDSKRMKEITYYDKQSNIISKEEWEKVWIKDNSIKKELSWTKDDNLNNEINNNNKFINKALEIGKLVTEKNKAYGNAFIESEKILKILYPNGIKPEQYIDVLGMVRIIDKQFRIANAKDAFGENPWKDIAGYGICMSTVE